jgi:hypothetical protein
MKNVLAAAWMLSVVGCVTDVGPQELAVGVAEQELEAGLYTRINSKLFSDGDGPASPLHDNERASDNSDWLRCWVMALAPDADWACNEVNCRCIGGACPEESYWPVTRQTEGIWFIESNFQTATPNFTPYRTEAGANWPTYAFSQEVDENWQPCVGCGVVVQGSICNVFNSGTEAAMHVGGWIDQR